MRFVALATLHHLFFFRNGAQLKILASYSKGKLYTGDKVCQVLSTWYCNLRIIVSAETTSMLPNFLSTRPMSNFLYCDQIPRVAVCYDPDLALNFRVRCSFWPIWRSKGQGAKPKYAVTTHQSINHHHSSLLALSSNIQFPSTFR